MTQGFFQVHSAAGSATHHHGNNINSNTSGTPGAAGLELPMHHQQRMQKLPQDLVTFIDSKGNQQTISLIFNPSEQGTVVQCCDPYNEKVYYLPLALLDRTSGLETHISNRTGRRAQICMKHQQLKCNMREKCLQIHADYNMVETLRQLYYADRKAYVSEVLVLDPTDGRNDTLSFKYSEIEQGAAKENYRKLASSQRQLPPVLLCGSFVASGMCGLASQCPNIHVTRERYLRAKTVRCCQPRTAQRPATTLPSVVGTPLVQPSRDSPSQQDTDSNASSQCSTTWPLGPAPPALPCPPILDDGPACGPQVGGGCQPALTLPVVPTLPGARRHFLPLLSCVDALGVLGNTPADCDPLEQKQLNTDLENSEDIQRMLSGLELFGDEW